MYSGCRVRESVQHTSGAVVVIVSVRGSAKVPSSVVQASLLSVLTVNASGAVPVTSNAAASSRRQTGRSRDVIFANTLP